MEWSVRAIGRAVTVRIILRTFPEVDDVVRRTGRAETTEDPMPHTVSDVLVVLKRDTDRSPEEREDAMRETLRRVPGVAVLFTAPWGCASTRAGRDACRHLAANLSLRPRRAAARRSP